MEMLRALVVLIPLKYIMLHANLRKFNQVMRIECSTLGFAYLC
jgi:hypothetical protein